MLTDDDQERPLSQQERREYSMIIKTNSDLLMNLVNDILDFSDLNSGRAKVTIMEVNGTGHHSWEIYQQSNQPTEP